MYDIKLVEGREEMLKQWDKQKRDWEGKIGR